MLGRGDIATINRHLIEEFVPPPPSEAWWWGLRTTSGTTGEPVVNIVRREEIEWFYRSQRSVMCLGTMGIRLHAVKTVRRDPFSSNATLALDAKDLTQALRAVFSDYRPAHFIGFPSFIMRAAEYLDNKTAQAVAGLHLVGETITAELEQTLRERFPNAAIRSMYVAAEFGVLSKPNCPYQPRNWYHPQSGITIELSDVDEHGVGDLLVSGERHGAVRVEKYRIGDAGRLKHGLCPCGERVAFEVVGRRGYDYLKLAGAILRQEEFDRVAAKLKLFDDYRAEVQAVADNGKLRGKIILRIFRSSVPDIGVSEEVSGRFAQELFVTPTRTLAELVASGDFLPLEVVWERKPFAKKHKDVKLVQSSGHGGETFG